MSVRMLKYQIPVQSMSTVLMMPAGVVVRCVGVQRPDEVCMWAEIPTEHKDAQREFVTVGTGQEVLSNWTYIGTAFSGHFVWHVYEVHL